MQSCRAPKLYRWSACKCININMSRHSVGASALQHSVSDGTRVFACATHTHTGLRTVRQSHARARLVAVPCGAHVLAQGSGAVRSGRGRTPRAHDTLRVGGWTARGTPASWRRRRPVRLVLPAADLPWPCKRLPACHDSVYSRSHGSIGCLCSGALVARRHMCSVGTAGKTHVPGACVGLQPSLQLTQACICPTAFSPYAPDHSQPNIPMPMQVPREPAVATAAAGTPPWLLQPGPCPRVLAPGAAVGALERVGHEHAVLAGHLCSQGCI